MSSPVFHHPVEKGSGDLIGKISMILTARRRRQFKHMVATQGLSHSIGHLQGQRPIVNHRRRSLGMKIAISGFILANLD
jgi:hypothetical protein